jgi:aerobic-type carbon monoxide dehydrogenase small subunit (CoxS/CutS family)
VKKLINRHKEGVEGGACTIFRWESSDELPIPAVRAHGLNHHHRGVAREGKLHPVQQAFIDKAAVQCDIAHLVLLCHL